MSKNVTTITLQGTRKRVRPRKRWTNELEKDLNIMGMRNWHLWPKTGKNGGRFYWKPRCTRYRSA